MASAERLEAFRAHPAVGARHQSQAGAAMIRSDFDAQIVRLMVLRFPPADVNEYFVALQDIDAEVFPLAIGHALKTRRDFPVPAELRADADHVAAHLRSTLEEP